MRNKFFCLMEVNGKKSHSKRRLRVVKVGTRIEPGVSRPPKTGATGDATKQKPLAPFFNQSSQKTAQGLETRYANLINFTNINVLS